MQATKTTNDNFTIRYKVAPLRNNPELQAICNRKSGYCLIHSRISRPSESNVHLGDYGWQYSYSRKRCIEMMNYELGNL